MAALVLRVPRRNQVYRQAVLFHMPAQVQFLRVLDIAKGIHRDALHTTWSSRRSVLFASAGHPPLRFRSLDLIMANVSVLSKKCSEGFVAAFCKISFAMICSPHDPQIASKCSNARFKLICCAEASLGAKRWWRIRAFPSEYCARPLLFHSWLSAQRRNHLFWNLSRICGCSAAPRPVAVCSLSTSNQTEAKSASTAAVRLGGCAS